MLDRQERLSRQQELAELIRGMTFDELKAFVDFARTRAESLAPIEHVVVAVTDCPVCESSWRPFKAAPKDGTRILLFFPTFYPQIVVARYRHAPTPRHKNKWECEGRGNYEPGGITGGERTANPLDAAAIASHRSASAGQRMVRGDTAAPPTICKFPKRFRYPAEK
jgi:hypothetical protein